MQTNILNDDNQRQISISVTKIFNWPQTEQSCLFELVFYPEEAQQHDAPIIQKSVVGSYVSNSMKLNSLLKITYTDDEKIVIMKLIKAKKDRREVLGEFQIDFDKLRQKNVQYYPFGKDHVLQINLYNPPRASSRVSRTDEFKSTLQSRNSRLNSDPRLLEQQRYLQDRQIYLQRKRTSSRIGLNERYDSPNEPNFQESRIKKSFSEKVYNLLQEVKSMKQDILVGSKNNRQGKTNSQIRNNRQFEYNSDQNDNYGPRIKKSMSDGKFKTYGAAPPSSPSFRRQQRENQKESKSQKHRLILKTLNVVPCEQYYKNQSRGSNNRLEGRNTGQAAAYSSDYYQSRFQ